MRLWVAPLKQFSFGKPLFVQTTLTSNESQFYLRIYTCDKRDLVCLWIQYAIRQNDASAEADYLESFSSDQRFEELPTTCCELISPTIFCSLTQTIYPLTTTRNNEQVALYDQILWTYSAGRDSMKKLSSAKDTTSLTGYRRSRDAYRQLPRFLLLSFLRAYYRVFHFSGAGFLDVTSGA